MSNTTAGMTADLFDSSPPHRVISPHGGLPWWVYFASPGFVWVRGKDVHLSILETAYFGHGDKVAMHSLPLTDVLALQLALQQETDTEMIDHSQACISQFAGLNGTVGGEEDDCAALHSITWHGNLLLVASIVFIFICLLYSSVL